MIDSIRRMIQKYHLIPPDSTLVIGVSGGADSLALLHILYTLQTSLKCRIHVATLDHGLRGEAGAADAEYVCQFAESLGVPVTKARIDAGEIAATQRRGIEAAARQVRYEFLATVARQAGAERVAVAHHAGDQAETVLMHLLRGAGLAGLGGMSMAAPMPGQPNITLIRPLLWNTRAEIEAYCREHDLEPREDATNADPAFLRNKLRLKILPDLEKLNPHVQRALVQVADIARVEDDFVQQQLMKIVLSPAVQKQDRRVVIRREAFRNLHPALQRRLIAWAAKEVKPVEELDYLHIVDAVEMGVEGKQGGRALLTDGLQVRVDYDVLVVERHDEPPLDIEQPLMPESESIKIDIPGIVQLPESEWLLHVSLNASTNNIFPEVVLSIPQDARVMLRGRREGDRFEPLGMDGHSQKLNRWMINRKIPRHLRERIPLICVDDEIAAIFVNGQWFVSESSSVKDNSRRVVYFHFLQNL